MATPCVMLNVSEQILPLFFAVCGSYSSPHYVVIRGSDGRLQRRFWFCSGDIRDQNPKSAEITPNFGRFALLLQFTAKIKRT